MHVLAPDLVRPPWHGPAPAPCHPAAHGARWRRADWQSSLLGSPPGPYSTCPSFASTGGPPLEAGPPPHVATLRKKKKVWIWSMLRMNAGEEKIRRKISGEGIREGIGNRSRK